MIVIPMAGLSRRFTIAGYTVPKYMLPLNGASVFTQAVASFSALFETVPFLFVARPIADTETFIREECIRCGIADARIVMLHEETAGQAETVERGLAAAGISDSVPLTIFNIDTFRSKFHFPSQAWFARSDGYLEVFEGEGANWSYVAPSRSSDEPLVVRTTEKQPISNLCCNGLYHFARAVDLRWALHKEREYPQSAELYIAPLYNHLISIGRQIHYDIVPRSLIKFCGVPSEYDELRRNEVKIFCN